MKLFLKIFMPVSALMAWIVTLVERQKLMWVIGLLPLNIVIMPLYFLVYRTKIRNKT